MFFADWVDAVPFAEAPAAAVRDLDSLASEVSYWVPAVALVIALRQVWVWPPAVALLVVTLGGVGYTMFVPHALTTHLAWLAAAVVTLVLLGTALVSSSVPRGSVSSAGSDAASSRTGRMRRQALADLPERLSLTSAAEAVAGREGLGKKTVRHERSQLRTRRGLDGSLAQVLQSQLAVRVLA